MPEGRNGGEEGRKETNILRSRRGSAQDCRYRCLPPFVAALPATAFIAGPRGESSARTREDGCEVVVRTKLSFKQVQQQQLQMWQLGIKLAFLRFPASPSNSVPFIPAASSYLCRSV
eukprot:GHVU01113648.1.p3 GENE.GHVU01113648.1~~GHVU01113648.1.p3  ORF type:complete len:117 (-),score=8.56 GHVU01113648.1:2112-2462(-)